MWEAEYGNCGETQAADWSAQIIPEPNIGIRLQTFLGWINNYYQSDG
jgi:transposase